MFYVIAGEWTDTNFNKLIDGTLEVRGPFSKKRQALNVWRGCAQQNVDNAHHRAFITTPRFDPESMEPSFELGGNYTLNAEPVMKLLAGG